MRESLNLFVQIVNYNNECCDKPLEALPFGRHVSVDFSYSPVVLRSAFSVVNLVPGYSVYSPACQGTLEAP